MRIATYAVGHSAGNLPSNQIDYDSAAADAEKRGDFHSAAQLYTVAATNSPSNPIPLLHILQNDLKIGDIEGAKSASQRLSTMSLSPLVQMQVDKADQTLDEAVRKQNIVTRRTEGTSQTYVRPAAPFHPVPAPSTNPVVTSAAPTTPNNVAPGYANPPAAPFAQPGSLSSAQGTQSSLPPTAESEQSRMQAEAAARAAQQQQQQSYPNQPQGYSGQPQGQMMPPQQPRPGF